MTHHLRNYDEKGMRLTDCCGAVSTYDEYGQLYCKACYEPVRPGEGDGTEGLEEEDDESDS